MDMTTDPTNWKTANLTALQQRLAWLNEQEDGILFCQSSGVHYVVVRKNNSQVRLSLVEQVNLKTDLVQSVLDFKNPLNLVSEYTQAMMLSLVWQNSPKRIYLAGFGGGRIPLVLHHYCPEAVIECADIDATAVEIATKFFGIELDRRLKVAIQDGREYLELLPSEVVYDIIMSDVFFGNGYMPHRLATQEFYELCKKHLSPDGIVAVNLLQRDEFYTEKIETIKGSFSQVYLCPWKDINTVVFATNSPFLDRKEIISKATQLQEERQFPFPLLERVLEVQVGERLSELLPKFEEAKILRDELPPEGYFNNWLL